MSVLLRIVTAVLLVGVCLTRVPYVQHFLRGPDMVRPLTVYKLSWNNCSEQADIMHAVNFSLSPDPIVLPGTVNISFSVQYLQDFGSPLKASVLIAKKIGANYIKIPCIGQFGTCDYDDFCEILGFIPECPDPLPQYNISCQCPFAKGSYALPPTSFQLSYIPLVKGDYHARINLTTTVGSADRHVGCYEVYLSLSEQYSIFGKI